MLRIDAVAGEDIWGSDLFESEPTGPPVPEPGPAIVSHVVDFYRRYPGETVTFYTLLDIREDLSDLTLRISLPSGLTLGNYQPPAERAGTMPELEIDDQARYLVWPLAGQTPAGSRYEYRAEAGIAPTGYDQTYESQAVLVNSDRSVLARETVSIMVSAKGRYLKHLPALYEKDELMGRFLMLFESFWEPVEQQIDSIPYYFDPRITPGSFLPWLAAWLDLNLDERWPQERLRQLIRWAIALHRSRGTKWGLLKYLEIYTGRPAQIIEKHSENFRLGPEARLGPGIALGLGNIPHTFSVNLRLPLLEAEDEEEAARQEKARRRTIESIIDMQKPAHTVYTLNLEIVSPEELETEAEQQPEPAADEQVDEISAQAAIWFRLDDEPAPSPPPKPARKKRKSSRSKGKKS